MRSYWTDDCGPLDFCILIDGLNARHFSKSLNGALEYLGGNGIDVSELLSHPSPASLDSTNDAVIGLVGFDENALPLLLLLRVGEACRQLNDQESNEAL